VYGATNDQCLNNFSKVSQRCEDVNLVLNWEKCHFMVQEGVVLGHVVSKKGIEVDKAQLEIIEKLRPLTTLKGVRSFLRHISFYQRFIKGFSKIVKPLPNYLSRMCLLSLMKNA